MLTGVVVQGVSIMVFISDNEASQHAVNLAVALARQEVDSVHVMHACTNEGGTPDAQKLMARCTQGLGPHVNSEVMVRPAPPPLVPPLPSFPPPLAPSGIIPQAYFMFVSSKGRRIGCICFACSAAMADCFVR